MNSSFFNSQLSETKDDYIPRGSSESQISKQGGKIQCGRKEHDQAKESLWSIDDDTLFYPLGFTNHCTDNKSVFLTWSENYLLIFIFKTSQKPQGTRLTKVRLDMYKEEIIQILILEFNTLLLMRSGRIFHFSSVKSIQEFKWLQDVRCITSSKEGFSVIRLMPHNRLHLEVYQDVINIELSDSTLLQSYDITFDETNVFNCNWENERFTILSIVIEEENVILLQKIAGLEDGKLMHKKEIFIFTVSGNMFALIPEWRTDGHDYHIRTCATYVSNVEFIKVLIKPQLFLVFLASGSIDIWFISNVMQILKRSTHYTGSEFIDYVFANDGCFYYANSEKVARLKFYYDSVADDCSVKERSKVIYGILACTWIENKRHLICLSNNNIFYQVGFEGNFEDDKIEYENLNRIYKLSPTKVVNLVEQAQILNEWERAPNEIHKSIEQEYLKQELITIGRKPDLYRGLCLAHLEFRKYMTKIMPLPLETIIMHIETGCTLSSSSLFTFIYIDITKHDAFQSAFWWSLHITNNSSGECYVFRIKQEMLHKNLCAVIPIDWHKGKLLPTFGVLLNAFITMDSEYAAISLPFKITLTPGSIKRLFSNNWPVLNENFKPSNLSKLIADITRTSAEKDGNEYYLRRNVQLPEGCSFNSILDLFKLSDSTSTFAQYLHLNFLSTSLSISYSLQDNCISVESTDAAVLYYVKYYILMNLMSHNQLKAPEYLVGSEDRATLLQYQARVERCYGQIQPADYDFDYTDTLHIEHLQRIYNKLRSELQISRYIH